MVESAEEVMKLLTQGNANRIQEATKANETSSRSHAVLQITVEKTFKNKVTVGKFSLIDLAGSERASKTQNEGVRLQEGAMINKSLLALGNCINALYSKSSHVPFRDSKLTRLLKNSLGGNSRTLMIANVSPCSSHMDDSHNTLKYASRTKDLKTYVTTNVKVLSIERDEMVKQLKSEIQQLQTQLSKRHSKIDVLNPARNNSPLEGSNKSPAQQSAKQEN